MNTLEYRLENRQSIKTFEAISSLETSIRFFVNYWVNEGIVYENRGNYFLNGKYFIDLYECKDEQPYADAIPKAPTLLNTVCFIQKERSLRNLLKRT